jgi:Flp pilus assembly protein TadG
MRRLSEDRGATAVTVAVVMAVLLGMAGLAVDAGALYQERRELGNGADAAALAIAEDCGLLVKPCDEPTARATAASYASANARDCAAAVSQVVVSTGTRRVSVVTSTQNADGSTVLEPFFARVVGFDGATVQASATAVWGYPRSLPRVLPLIISKCEFERVETIPSPPSIIFFHDGNNAEPCNAQAGQDADGDGLLAGGFGWLDTPGSCEVALSIRTWADADPGSSPSTGCTPNDLTELLGREIPLPYFDDLEEVGANGRYHIAGFGMFHVTGYNFGGGYKAPDALSAPCSGDERCISGYFTRGTVFEGEIGGPDHGVVIVKLVD